MRTSILAFIALSFCVGTAAAQNRNDRTIEELPETDSGRPTVLIMKPDIEYHLQTAGGVTELHEEWTMAARSNFVMAVEEFGATRDVNIVVMPVDQELTQEEMAYVKLHWAVGQTLGSYHLMAQPLKTKNKEMDWSLGEGIAFIGEQYDADYALFSFYRDIQASGGRIAMSILTTAATAAATGGATAVAPTMGGESGFATLIDLKTGDVVWANWVGAGRGELRDEDGARTAVKHLFTNLPE